MAKPPVKLFPLNVSVESVNRDWRVRVKGLAGHQVDTGVWSGFAIRVKCQAPDCDNNVDTPARFSWPVNKQQAMRVVATEEIEPRGCIRHPPSTWVYDPR